MYSLYITRKNDNTLTMLVFNYINNFNTSYSYFIKIQIFILLIIKLIKLFPIRPNTVNILFLSVYKKRSFNRNNYLHCLKKPILLAKEAGYCNVIVIIFLQVIVCLPIISAMQ